MLHPHEKPVPILARIIETMPPGAVLDPCCGSGSTLMAAMELGRKCVGIETDPAYFEIARRRLDAELSQGRLFAPGASA